MQRPFEERFEEYIEANGLVNRDDNIVLGVSGGADSVCLLYLLSKYAEKVAFSLTVVHVNHMLRKDEAEVDAAFVQTICREMNIRCLVAKCDVRGLSKAAGMSIEEAGRSARYRTFEKVAESMQQSKIAVAHNYDDNVETILLNMIRGTDLKGFTGMKPFSYRENQIIIRPLLLFTKEEIKEFLEMRKIQYREDTTNKSIDFTRNKIRNKVMPILNEINPRAATHIYNLSKAVNQVEGYTDWLAAEYFESAVTLSEGKATISLAKIEEADQFIKNKVIYNAIVSVAGQTKDISRTHIDKAVELIEKQTGRQVSLPYGMIAKKDYYDLVIETNNEAYEVEEPEFITIPHTEISWKKQSVEGLDGVVITCNLVLVTDENRKELMAKNECTKAFDYDRIIGDIILGVRSSGDRIVLKEGTKSLKKFFIDEKIPQERRKDILVLKDEESVLWVVGFRMSEQHKITEDTKMALQVNISGGRNEW